LSFSSLAVSYFSQPRSLTCASLASCDPLFTAGMPHTSSLEVHAFGTFGLLTKNLSPSLIFYVISWCINCFTGVLIQQLKYFEHSSIIVTRNDVVWSSVHH